MVGHEVLDQLARAIGAPVQDDDDFIEHAIGRQDARDDVLLLVPAAKKGADAEGTTESLICDR